MTRYLLVWLCLPLPVLAQASAPPEPDAERSAPHHLVTEGPIAEPDVQRTFGEFLLVRKNGERIEGRSGSLTAARLSGVSAKGGQLDVLPDDIQMLYVRDGTHAGEIALYGAGAGLAFSGLVLLRLQLEDPKFFRHDSAAPISLALVGGSTALGALIGLAVGAAKPRWRVEPLVVPGQRYSLHLAVSL
jgi:hypothetical protein